MRSSADDDRVLPMTPSYDDDDSSSRRQEYFRERATVMACYNESPRTHDPLLLRQCMAEFLGTFVLVLFGDGAVAQTVLSKGEAGSYLGITIAWGLGVAMGIYVAGGVSGAHLNPAVTLTLAAWQRFEWKKVPFYMLSQLIGAFAAAGVVYCVYYPLLHEFDLRETAKIFATYPQSDQTMLSAVVSEICGTALLLGCLFAICDEQNMPACPSSKPGAIGSLVVAIGLAFGYNTGYAINPARDFGPRLFTSMAGWGSDVFTASNSYFWIPLLAPCFGGVLGAAIYSGFVEYNHRPTTELVINPRQSKSILAESNL